MNSPAASNPVTGARWPAIGALVIVASCLLAYSPSLRGGFLWDDDVHISQNAMLTSGTGLLWIWTRPGATPQYYPVTHTTFWIEHQVWGLNPTGYHVVNVLLHALSAILVWRLCFVLRPSAGLAWGFVAALVFALHPVHVESVAWMTERKNVLSCTLYLASALAFLKGLDPVSGKVIGRRWIIGSLALFAGALLSKSVTGTLPAALVLVIWWKFGRVRLVHIAWLLPMFAAAIVMSRVTTVIERDIVGASGPEWNLDFSERARIAGHAVWFYLSKLFWPANLTFVYPRWEVSTLSWVAPSAVVVTTAALVVLISKLGRGVLVAWLIFLGTLFPALGFVNIYPMRYAFVADHFQYHASIAVIVIVCAALSRVVRTKTHGSAGASPYLVIGVVVSALLGTLTLVQARNYVSSETLWTDTINKNDSCWMAFVHLGRLRAEQQQFDDAIGCFAKSIELNPTQPEGHIEMGNLLLALNQPGKALEAFHSAYSLRPDKAYVRYHLAKGFAGNSGDSRAIAELRSILRDEPRFEAATLFLGSILERLGRRDEAIQAYRDGIAAFPESVRCRSALERLVHE